MKHLTFAIVLMFGSMGTAFASFDAYIAFMDVTEDDKVNLYLTDISNGTSEATCSANLVYLGHNSSDSGSTTSSHIYSAALSAMIAGKKIRLHTVDCVTKSIRIYK